MDKGIRQMRYFVEVARGRSYRLAAEKLHVTQPPLTRQIKALERELGTPLLRRHTRKVLLTPEGEHAADVFGRCLDRFDLAVQTVVAAGRRDDGRFLIGVPWWTDLTRLPELDALARDYLGYDGVEATIYPSAIGADRVRDGLLDAALVAEPVDTHGLVVKPVASLGLLAALPSGHHLARRASVPLAALGELPAFVVFSRRINPLHFRALHRYCSGMGLVVKRLIQVDDAPSVLQWVATGKAAAVFNDISCPNLDFSGVTLLPISSPSQFHSRVSLVSREDNPIPVPDALRDAICSLLRPTPLVAASNEVVTTAADVGVAAPLAA